MKLRLEEALLLRFIIDFYDTWWMVYLSRKRGCEVVLHMHGHADNIAEVKSDGWCFAFSMSDRDGKDNTLLLKQGVKNNWTYS